MMCAGAVMYGLIPALLDIGKVSCNGSAGHAFGTGYVVLRIEPGCARLAPAQRASIALAFGGHAAGRDNRIAYRRRDRVASFERRHDKHGYLFAARAMRFKRVATFQRMPVIHRSTHHPTPRRYTRKAVQSALHAALLAPLCPGVALCLRDESPALIRRST
jgi:hypothetical protein